MGSLAQLGERGVLEKDGRSSRPVRREEKNRERRARATGGATGGAPCGRERRGSGCVG